MQRSSAVAFVVCVAIVAAAYGIWYQATARFNPNPQASSLDTASTCLPSDPGCPAFSIVSASLTVSPLNSSDYTSQGVSLALTSTGTQGISKFRVFFSGVALGNLTSPLAQGHSSTRFDPVPTTLTVVKGHSYVVAVEGLYLGSSGSVLQRYWQSVTVVAQ